MKLLTACIGATIARVHATQRSNLVSRAAALQAALDQLVAATQSAWATGVPEQALANAVPYLQAFGHVVIAWLWLDVAVAARAPHAAKEIADDAGVEAACRYFFEFELPRIDAWLRVVAERNDLCLSVSESVF